MTRTRTASLGDYLRAAFEGRFSSLGVDTRAVVLTGLELDENEIDRGRVDFGATTTMTVRRTGEKVDVHRGGYYSGGVYIPTTSTTITYFFDVSLWDAALDRRVWRARPTARRGTLQLYSSFFTSGLLRTTTWATDSISAVSTLMTLPKMMTVVSISITEPVSR